MFDGAIGTAIAKRLTASASEAVSDWVKDRRRIRTVAQRLEEGVAEHLAFLSGWSSDVVLERMAQPRSLSQIFVDLDLNLRPRWQRDGEEGDRSYKVSDLWGQRWNIILVGDPGAGKTTSLKKLVAEHLTRLRSNAQKRRTPILLRCRTLEDGATFEGVVADALNINMAELFGDAAKVRRNLPKLLRSINAVLLVDGLDELPRGIKSPFIQEVGDYIRAADEYRMIVTSRTAFFNNPFENARVMEVSPLSSRQVGNFARKWLGRERAQRFLDQVRRSPYAGTEMRPLTLAHLCLIFSRTKQVPEKPRSVYRMIVRLLLQEWDGQRGVSRASDYAAFEVDQKEEFLESLSFRLSLAGVKGEFDHETLEDHFREIAVQFGLPERQSDAVAREIETHTGLVIRTGTDSYEFAHRSLQEYLAAQFIVRAPLLPLEPHQAVSMPGELAIATVLSSSSSTAFRMIVELATREDGGAPVASNELGDWAAEYLQRLVVEGARFLPSGGVGVVALVALHLAEGGVFAARGTVGALTMKVPGVAESISGLGFALMVRRHGETLILQVHHERLSDAIPESDELFERISFRREIPTDIQFARAVGFRVD